MQASTRKRRQAPITQAKSPELSRLPRVNGVDPDNVRNALAEARSQSFDDFRRTEVAWLVASLTPLASAIERSFASTISVHGPEVADASLMGSYLGGAIVRSSIRDGLIGSERCLGNLLTWDINALDMVYDPEQPVDHQTLLRLFGTEVANEFGEIRSDPARTLSTIVVTMSLEPHR